MSEIKPFTLYYFVLRVLAANIQGLNLADLKSDVSKQQEKPLKDGSLYGTLSKLKASGLIKTSIDIVEIEGNEEPVRIYSVTSKGDVYLRNAFQKIQQEEIVIKQLAPAVA